MSVLTSVRLNDMTKQQLDFFSVKEQRPKNWIINEALTIFFENKLRQSTIDKVKLECLLFNQQDENNQEFIDDWENLAIETWDE